MKEKVLNKINEKYNGDVEVARVIEGSEYVSVHFKNEQDAVVEIYKTENGDVKEIISNRQKMPDTPNPSGHTMLDGETEIKDLDKTEINKKIIFDVETKLMQGKANEIASYFEGNNYINHNPEAYDGLTGVAKGIQERIKAGIITKYNKIALVFAQGNFVQLVVEGTMNDEPILFCDIFRVENEKIAEHWDVVAKMNN